MSASVRTGQRGKDIYTVVGLQLKEAAIGVEKVVTAAVNCTCTSCKVLAMWEQASSGAQYSWIVVGLQLSEAAIGVETVVTVVVNYAYTSCKA